jgi:hypothetical protein
VRRLIVEVVVAQELDMVGGKASEAVLKNDVQGDEPRII